MKAIIELGRKGKVFATARKQLAAGAARDYRLSFESARMLFAELTPARRRDRARALRGDRHPPAAERGCLKSRRWRDGARCRKPDNPISSP